MLAYKFTLVILSLYLYNIIINSEYLQIPDKNYELVLCTPISNGYEYKNIVLETLDTHSKIYPLSPINCWYGCYPNSGCKVFFEQPKTYGYTTRFLMAIITLLNIIIFTYF